ncbi:terpenoid synthase [Xylariaceae sp. FL0016]|nr:terpenoid synthase [Xylariaceae sp. FL0016]
MTQIIMLPDFEAGWKWPRQVNPFTNDIRQESQAWTASFGAFSPRAQKSFDRCDFNLLTGLLYPRMKRGTSRLRCANDLMNLFFIFDDSDKSEPADVWNQVGIIMDALRHPTKPRPEGEWVGGEVARQFWTHTSEISTQVFQRRFIDSLEGYLRGTAQQAEDRHTAHIRDMKSYLEVRRETIGVISSFNMLEMDMDIPEDVRTAPDVLSYNKEQASGDDQHNLLTIVMNEKGMQLQETIDWAGQLHAEMVVKFNQLLLEVPRYGGPLDLDIQSYVDGVAQWVVANVQWSFESERYFGKQGLEVKATRMTRLLPKRSQEKGPNI